MLRRQWLAMAMTGLGIGFAESGRLPRAEEMDDIRSTDSEGDEPELQDRKEINWNPLVEWHRAEGGRWIESIDVDLLIRDARTELPVQKHVFQISDVKALKIFESIHHSPFSPLRVVMSSNSGGGAGGGATIGTLRVNATRDSFLVGVTVGGFCYQGKVLQFDRQFFSYAWSYALDEAVFAQSGAHLPLTVVMALSGEMRMQHERNLVFSGGLKGD